MKFKLDMTANFLSDEKKKKYDGLGFKFNSFDDKDETDGWLSRYSWIFSDEQIPEIEINSLEELIKFSKKYGELIINTWPDGKPKIEIYNDYRE